MTRVKEKMIPVSINVPKVWLQTVDFIAKKLDVSRSELLREAFVEFVKIHCYTYLPEGLVE